MRTNEVFSCAHTKLVELKTLKPNPKNPNKHPKDQIERLAKIIEYQGQRAPIVVSNRSGFITKGHGRLEALRALGWIHAAVDYQDYEDEAQEYADIVADNAIGAWAEMDLSEINKEMLDFGPDFDLDMLGLEGFVVEPAEIIPPAGDPDSVPTVEFPITFKGDIWVLGNHRLMCGDSTLIDEVEKLMNGGMADMVFTDPPYGVSYQSNMTKKFEVIKNDDVFLDFNPILEVYMKNNTAAIIWTSQQVYPKWREMFEDKYKSTIIWFKRGGGMGDLAGDFAPNYEMALYCTKGKPKFVEGRPGAVWDIAKDGGESYVHPTQKPVALSEYGMEQFVGEGAVVLDLFGGSGSTLIGCERTARCARIMELDEKYVDVIIKRWEGYSGKKAILEATGQTYEELKAERDGKTA